MTRGFFASSTLAQSKTPQSLIPKCGICQLYKGCLSPKMPVAGKGKRKILIFGEGPGSEEDKRNKPFVGVSGQLLKDSLHKYGVDLFRDCWVSNAVICRTDNTNRTPTAAEIEYCRPNAINAIKKYKPETIILLGGPAVTSIIGWLWREDPGGIGRWAGFAIPNQMLNCWIIPTFHPAYVLREPAERSVVPLFFKRHLKVACEKQGRPWKVVPNYKEQVTVVTDPDEAAVLIKQMVAIGEATSFDYEVNMLKPDWSDRRIVCSSMSNGKQTIAYPWHGKAITATKEFLLSDVPKIGANIKFETRWSLAELGIRVNNWLFDTMIASHLLDNRRGATSLKFQAFVRLGFESYNDHIAPYLKSKGNARANQILQETSLRDRLLYCGIDSLVTWHLAQIQMREIGI